ncbi:hypothetical protein A0H81_10376 [Grifola frondosa]|uniref:Uncharacterized protein n=1 Tax=Grifola frondosa TaxID=5627 RepID=A0A1C7LYY1_GRIFR|nr:hypothetical protein A0H81_10376 [Grifola frondosa]
MAPGTDVARRWAISGLATVTTVTISGGSASGFAVQSVANCRRNSRSYLTAIARESGGRSGACGAVGRTCGCDLLVRQVA